MFRRKTTFLLGAGASWHYGYPTGDRLVADVADAALPVAGYLDRRITLGLSGNLMPKIVSETTIGHVDTWSRYGEVSQKCKDLASRLRTAAKTVRSYQTLSNGAAFAKFE